jgi:hypothetical protein
MIRRMVVGGRDRGVLVSVVIPAFNYAHFLPDTVDSVRRQTLAGWRCIIVDDGSTDGTAEVARALSSVDGRISYHHQPNRGLAAARNTGLALADGRYVQFLDADDLIAPTKLEAQVEALESRPDVGLCYSGYQAFRSGTGQPLGRYAGLELSDDPLHDFLYRWQRGLTIPLHCALFRADLWPGRSAFDERLRAKEDWLMWIELARRDVKMHFLDADLAWYRAHRGNMTIDKPAMVASFARAAEIAVGRLAEEERPRFVDRTTAYLATQIEDHLSKASSPMSIAAGAAAQPSRRAELGSIGRAGGLWAQPNPVKADGDGGLAETTLRWEATAEDDVEIHIGAPDGPLFCRARGGGQAATGRWVRDGTAFYLQHAAPGLPLTADHTLAIEIVQVFASPPGQAGAT